MNMENKYKIERKLEIGEVIKIDGFPYEYLGDEKVGTNTDIQEIYEPTISNPPESKTSP